MTTPFQQHVARWKDCQACELSCQRSRVVLCRGSLPCDVLFVGEAPGVSEDALGLPFVGPAGKLLDQIVYQALEGRVLRHAFTNLVACFPAEAKRTDDHAPPDAAIKACSARLKELVHLARPRVIVLVGTLARKHFVQTEGANCVEIMHPAAILRMPTAGQSLAVRKAVVTIRNAVRNLV